MNSIAAARFPPASVSSKGGQDTSIVASGPTRHSEVQDEALISRTQSGDREALGWLFQRYERLIRSVATRILRDDVEAQDLVQDLFLFIQRKAGIFDCSKSSARSWIVQMTYQRAIERRRYLATRQFYVRSEFRDRVEEVVGRPTGEDDYSPEAVFGRNGLKKVLDALSDDQRETLCLFFFEGFTLAEISNKLGQPLGNVRHHYYRALDKLRKQMFAGKLRAS